MSNVIKMWCPRCGREMTMYEMLEEFVEEVKKVGYSPEFEHMGPLVVAAEKILNAANPDRVGGE